MFKWLKKIKRIIFYGTFEVYEFQFFSFVVNMNNIFVIQSFPFVCMLSVIHTLCIKEANLASCDRDSMASKF